MRPDRAGGSSGFEKKRWNACQWRRRVTSVATSASVTQGSGAWVKIKPATSTSIVANEGRSPTAKRSGCKRRRSVAEWA
jgi:hypothetical protein